MEAKTEEPIGCVNTDREIWREREGDFYADSIHVTKGGAIGINCGGFVSVRPVRFWHAAPELYEALKELVELKAMSDANGPRAVYEERKPIAWENARAALSRVEEQINE
jgi:hypothetical protein